MGYRPVPTLWRYDECQGWVWVRVEEHPSDPSEGARRFDIDTSGSHPARLHNYLAGGDDNFSADRDVADYVSEVVPGGIETAMANVQAMAHFLVRAVRHLVGVGIRQFLAVGVTVPTGDNALHVLIQKEAPASRVVYVGDDPLVLAHAHELRRSSEEGATAYVHGSLHDAEKILLEAGDTLDLTQPVAIVLLATLSLIADDRDPHGIVQHLVGGVPSGSYLVIAHTTNDIPAEGMAEAAQRLAETLGSAYVVRSQDEILRFFDGLKLLDPGLVQVDRWRPEPTSSPDTDRLIPIYAAVASKP